MRLRTYALVFLSCLPTLSTGAEQEPAKIYEPGWLDRNHLENQVERIDEVARSRLGTRIHNNRDDLELLQRIVNKGLIGQQESLELQAMGAVLGNLLVKELGLKWMIYEDAIGRSRAVCVPETEYCLFPITMFSRRMEVGIIVNVEDIHRKAVELITPYLPKNPYNE